MNVWKISTLVLASALVVVASGSAVPSASAGEKKDKVEKKEPAKDEKDQKQPNMLAAEDHLAIAIEKLEKATPDKGGHRVKAIKLAKDALEEVKLGIKWDDEHVSKDEAAKKDAKKK